MRLALLTALLTAPAAPAGAQQVTPEVTQERAMTLPPAELAELVFRQLGARMTAVSRPANPNGLVSPSLERLAFAGNPLPASVGLCTAMRVELVYAPSGSDGSTRPARLSGVRAGEVFKVTGEVEPYAEVSEVRAAEEARRCAAAGPVIPAVQGDLSRAYYFSFEGEALPELSLLVLQQAVGEAREGRYRAVSCAAGARATPACRDPAALLGGLSLGNLVSLRIAPPGPGGHRQLIHARFLAPGANEALPFWSVTVEADISRPADAAAAIERLGRTEIARSDAPAP